MLKKTILIILSLLSLSLLFSSQVFAIGCEFDTYNSSCSRFSSSFNSFNLNFAPIENYDNFTAKIYNKYNPSNQILIDINLENKQVKNINPFVEPGVYVLEVTSYNKGKKSNVNTFEYIFDNLRPMPPVISTNLHSTSSVVIVNGKTEEKSIKVIAEIKDKANSEAQSVNGEFSLNLNNLDSGLNYVKFYTISENGLKSFPVERIIVSNDIVEMNLENANSIVISNLQINERTYFENNEYYTSKQNFYITGTANGEKGAQIYVNGQRAVFDGNKYGAFILLNHGENNIVVQSGIETKTIIVNYIDLDFQFLQFDYNKVFEGDFILKGNTTANLPFEVYVNGVYLDKNSNYIKEEMGVYSFEYTIPAGNLKSGKNYIYLEGYNNEHLIEIVYKDIENPKIELLSFQKIASKKELAFKISDDIAINDMTLNLNFGPRTLSQASSKLYGDIYVFDVTQIIDETPLQKSYDYTLSIKDLTGKESSISGNINVDTENTLIESFSSSQKNVFSFGNKLFIPNGNVELIVKPSKAIAFKKIYLDGIEQINYNILRDNTILLNISTEKKTGEIKFIFINQNYQDFEQKYTYYSKLEEPEVKLDYIINPYAKSSEYILVTGEIIDSNFNWSSLKFNGIENNYHRYGNYFEAKVIPNNNGLNSLIISGNDYSKNSLNKQYLNLITKDTSQSSVSIYSDSNIFSANLLNSITNNVIYSDTRMKNYFYDFAGFNVEKTYLQNQFELSLPQRNGIQDITLKGVESSGQLFQKIINLKLDSFNPNIYLFYNQTSNKYMVIVDGTYSAVDVSKVNITSNNTNLDISTCNYKPGYVFYGYCRYLDNVNGINTIQVYAEDISKNSKTKIFNLSDAQIVSPIPLVTVDIDNDGVSNGDDPDSNNDSNVDNFGDVIGNGTGNVDNDITLDINDSDIDNDGISNGDDPDLNGDGNTDNFEDVIGNGTGNVDNDITVDINDGDIDNDGISNGDDPDVNGDGNTDNFEEEIGTGTGNTDGDSTTDINDSDIDGDGILNGDDSDVNGDGISNEDNVNSSCSIQTENIFLTYDTNITNNNDFIINGNFLIDGCNGVQIQVTNGFNESVGTCGLGQNSFNCSVSLSEGDNILNVMITGIDGHSINEVVIIKKDTQIPQILINTITANALYKVNDNLYYINTQNLVVNLNLSEKSTITLITNGNEKLKGQNTGIFNIGVDLTSDINLAENKTITLQIKAKDGAENEGFSEMITLIYNRVAKIFVQVSVE